MNIFVIKKTKLTQVSWFYVYQFTYTTCQMCDIIATNSTLFEYPNFFLFNVKRCNLPFGFSCLSPKVPELKGPDSSAKDPFRLNRKVWLRRRRSRENDFRRGGGARLLPLPCSKLLPRGERDDSSPTLSISSSTSDILMSAVILNKNF